MLVPIFSLNLSNKICARTVAIGKYDGTHPCITAATLAGKVFIHNPHKKSAFIGLARTEASVVDSDLNLLNINAVVTSLSTGRLDHTSLNDTLLVGTSTSVLGYDVENNTDIFFKELADGANSISIGNLGTLAEPVAAIGGNCAITAINRSGEEVLWTVTGDNVSSLILFDYDSNNQNELIVGSDDSDIRVFKNDELISEMSENSPILALTPICDSKFGYALINGSIGVYDKNNRLWRIKSKNLAMSIDAFDIDSDGVPELVTGWSNGKIDAKNCLTGEVVFKCSLDHAVAGLLHCDYKMDGMEQLICCSVEGEIKGFKPSTINAEESIDRNVNQDLIRDLSQRKLNLLLELKNLEEASKPSVIAKIDDDIGTQSTGIPADTQLTTLISTREKSESKPGHVELKISTSNETVIKAVIIFAEGIFKNESHVTHPPNDKLSTTLSVPILVPRDIEVDLHIQILVGFENALQYHVFDLTRPLVKFSMYKLVENSQVEEPKSYVTFMINERIPRITIWLSNNFILTEDLSIDKNINLTFTALRNERPLIIRMEPNGQFTIKTDNMELAGELVQSLITYLNISDLQVTCDFPDELDNLKQTLQKIDQYHSVRQQLTAQMADHSNLIRNLLVRTEDSRLMEDITGMKRNYFELMNMNRDLVNGYKIRCSNHEELLKNVKNLNVTIQKAGNLRGGKFKTETINNCRQAIKQNNSNALFKIIRTGVA